MEGWFDNKAFREAIINAVLHNYWASGNEPVISVYSDRIEIQIIFASIYEYDFDVIKKIEIKDRLISEVRGSKK